MPLTAKGEKIMAAMKEKYGDEEGERVFYASENKGKIKGVHDKKAGEIPMKNEQAEILMGKLAEARQVSGAEIAYFNGIMDKCAAAGIDPEELVKDAQAAKMFPTFAKLLRLIKGSGKMMRAAVPGSHKGALGKFHKAYATGTANQIGKAEKSLKGIEEGRKLWGSVGRKIKTPAAFLGGGAAIGGADRILGDRGINLADEIAKLQGQFNDQA